MAKSRDGNQMSKIALIYLHSGDMPHIVEKLSMKATTLISTSHQLEIYMKCYGPLKLQES
jgi:hypothetical protein